MEEVKNLINWRRSDDVRVERSRKGGVKWNGKLKKKSSNSHTSIK